MQFQIKYLIIWPKKENTNPNIVEFELDAVNVITGSSRTGKSAVSGIIEYCLGSHDCPIPVGKVRDHASWFGIAVSMNDGLHLFARRNKRDGEQKIPGDCFRLHIQGRKDIPPPR